MVIFENVSKFILSDITFYVPQGEIVGLIGTSGAGKTTMIKLLCGLLEPEKGRVRIGGKNPVIHRGKYGKELSVFISGMPLLEGEDTVKQGMELIKGSYLLDEEQFARDYQELGNALAFHSFEEVHMKELSLGQRMRAELGAALILRPKLLVLDEPDIGLDENGKNVLRELLTKRCEEGMSVLLTSHDMSEISGLCNRIALLEKGKLMYYGTEDNLRGKYAPIDTMTLKIVGKFPDFEDLPLKHFCIEGDMLTLSYDSRHISAAEILQLILKQTEIAEVKIRKTNLEKILVQLSRGTKKPEASEWREQ